MNTRQISERLVELCRQGQFEAAQTELYADDAVSIEPDGAPMELAEGGHFLQEWGGPIALRALAHFKLT